MESDKAKLEVLSQAVQTLMLEQLRHPGIIVAHVEQKLFESTA